MKAVYVEKSVALGEYIVRYGATVRDAAAHFGISKSTVHKYVTKGLRYTDPGLFHRVRAILDLNKAERHIRGGLATKEKYLHEKEEKKKGVSG